MNADKLKFDPLHGPSNLVRPSYSPGLLLQDDDLTQAVDYTRDLSRLLFRTLFGCGVLCGLKVSIDEHCHKVRIVVEKGVALDCHGDPVEVPKTQTLLLDPGCDPVPPTLCIVLRRHESHCMPRSAMCDDDDGGGSPAPTRTRDGFEIGLLKACPKCACGCSPVKNGRKVEKKEEAAESANAAGMVAPPPPAVDVIAGGKGKRAKAGEAAAIVEMQDMQRVESTDDADRTEHDCRCADPTRDCYYDHYAGVCSCDCCTDDWIVLAHATFVAADDTWEVDHSVRRFVRPVLMLDPLVWPMPDKPPSA